MRANSIFDIIIIECELQYGEGLYLSSHLKNAADANHGTLQNYLTWEAHLDWIKMFLDSFMRHGAYHHISSTT